jgi:signal transduction histidine kinase
MTKEAAQRSIRTFYGTINTIPQIWKFWLVKSLLSSENNEYKEKIRLCPDPALAGLTVKVEYELSHLPKNTALVVKSLEGLIPLIQEGIEERRRVQVDLRPPLLDNLGLLRILSRLCRP